MTCVHCFNHAYLTASRRFAGPPLPQDVGEAKKKSARGSKKRSLRRLKSNKTRDAQLYHARGQNAASYWNSPDCVKLVKKKRTRKKKNARTEKSFLEMPRVFHHFLFSSRRFKYASL